LAAKNSFALQLDIANFFNRIHRPTLFKLIQQRLVRAVRRQGLDRDEARALQSHCRALLANDPSLGARRKGTAASFASVPPHKRLSGQEAGRGLPIGNLTSQFFANVYLNELDQFVKHTLKARHYVRYVDDFVLLHEDPAQLVAWRNAIEGFLAERLGLALKARTEPKPVAAGVDFLGYIVRPHYRLARRRAVRRFRRVLVAFERRQVRANALALPPLARDKLRAQVASYRAHLSHAASHRLWQRTVADFPWLAALYADPAASPMARPLRPAWVPASVSGIAGQYRYFAQAYPDARVLIEVGNRWLLPTVRGSGLAREKVGAGETVGIAGKPAPTGAGADSDFAGAASAAKDCGAGIAGKPAPTRVGADLGFVGAALAAKGGDVGIAGKPVPTRHYPGLGPCAEFPPADLPGLRRRWKRQGIAHALVAQDGHFKTGFKRRALVLLWRPASLFPSFHSSLSTHRGAS
jgi:hypothetical protein